MSEQERLHVAGDALMAAARSLAYAWETDTSDSAMWDAWQEVQLAIDAWMDARRADTPEDTTADFGVLRAGEVVRDLDEAERDAEQQAEYEADWADDRETRQVFVEHDCHPPANASSGWTCGCGRVWSAWGAGGPMWG